MSKIILIALITLTLSGCYNTDSQKPEATYPTPHTQGAIITKEGSVIFYHEMWNDFTGMMYNL
jgi:PBP1b-binding outer membrane lipoprotein LpoB